MSQLIVNGSSSGTLKSLVFWLAVCTALWWLLADGGGWSFGLPTIVLATWVALRLRLSPWNVRLLRLPGFAWYFLRQAVSGALDVARRALQPRRPISPAWVRYRFRDDDPRVQLLVSAIVGLFPGTLASRVDGAELHVHLLSEAEGWEQPIEELERQLGRLLPRADGSR